MKRQIIELRLHPAARAWQKARPHAIGNGAKPEIEARRLHLASATGSASGDLPSLDHAADGLRRQNPRAASALSAEARTVRRV